MLKSDPVQKKLVEEELTTRHNDWKSSDWDELEWDNVKDLQVRELVAERKKMADVAQQADCLKCPKFVKHVSFSVMITGRKPLTQSSSQCNMTSG